MPQRADPARSEKAGQVSKVADQGSGCIAGAEYGPVSDYLHIAGRPHMKNERLHNGWQAGKHSHNNSTTY